MRIVWNKQTIQWFYDASEYTGYNRELAKILLKHIPLRTSLCDIGCGAGLIDFELAPYFKEITCVDIAEQAVSSIETFVREYQLHNITPLCVDATQLTSQWETVIALFHGGVSFLPKYFPFARERMLLVTFMERSGGFGPRNKKIPKCFHVADVESRLREFGIIYTLEKHSLEYGQPFRTYRDAEVFVQAYSQSMTKAEMTVYLDVHLQKTGREDFPYYLPKKKNFGLFVIRRDDNGNI